MSASHSRTALLLFHSFFAGILIGGIAVSGAAFENHVASAQTAGTSAPATVAAEVGRIESDITALIARKQQIEQDITKYEAELQKVGGEKATLQNAIYRLELERKKAQSDLIYTQNKIGATDLEIQKLNLEIADATAHISHNRAAIEEILRRINEADQTSLVETLFSNDDLSTFWSALDALARVRGVMSSKVRDLAELQTVLEGKVGEHKEKYGDLVALKGQYVGQKQVLEVNKSEKNQLLAQTKNEEAAYQELLAEKRAAKAQFEQQLREYEQRLQFILDPATIPPAGTVVFRWPLDSVTVTQWFGNTAFARSGAYNGTGHNGMDMRASKGTTVHAALAGEVIAVNVQVAPMCQYGKWVLIRHANGLTTLYAHLSVVSVSAGQQVATGDIIGYSGDTGYALGPHLHFTVYASKAVMFKEYTCNSGATLTIPIAAFSGYLDPMLYLPAI